MRTKRQMPKWKRELTREELKHIKELGVTSRAAMCRNVAFQDTNLLPCWTCVSIGKKLESEEK